MPEAETQAPAATDGPLDAIEVVGLTEIVERLRAEVPQPAGDRHDCLPPDLDYSLDCELEWGGIGCDDRAYVDIFDAGTFDWFVPLTRGGASEFPDIVAARHERWRTGAPIAARLALDWAGLSGLRWLYRDVSHDVAWQLVHGQGLGDLPDDASGALALLDVRDPACFHRFERRAGVVVRRCLEDVEIAGPEAFLAAEGAVEALYARSADRIRARNRDINRMLREYAENTPSQAVRLAAGAKGIRTPLQRRREKGLRKAIARSFDLLASIAGRQTARACLDGDAVHVEGRRFDFRLRVANLRSSAHGAVEVFVLDKDAVELASLCVYMQDTPALDQMAALILNVAHGNEEEILKRANVIRATAAAETNAPFREIRAAAAAARRMPEGLQGTRDGAEIEMRPTSADPARFLPDLDRELAGRIDRGVFAPLVGLFGERMRWERFASTGPAIEAAAPQALLAPA